MLCKYCNSKMIIYDKGYLCEKCKIYVANILFPLKYIEKIVLSIKEEMIRNSGICPLVFFMNLQKV